MAWNARRLRQFHKFRFTLMKKKFYAQPRKVIISLPFPLHLLWLLSIIKTTLLTLLLLSFIVFAMSHEAMVD